VPNVFTPNAEKAENRVFNAYGVHIAKFKMEIYNRWGEKVYHSDNLVKGWNGNYKGALAPIGEYTYVIEAETLDKKYIKRVGYVLLYY